jgi:hypothetical protein
MGETCSGGSCVCGAAGCPGGPTMMCCGGVCTDTSSDQNNCGVCDNGCAVGTQRCGGGNCINCPDICDVRGPEF